MHKTVEHRNDELKENNFDLCNLFYSTNTVCMALCSFCFVDNSRAEKRRVTSCCGRDVCAKCDAKNFRATCIYCPVFLASSSNTLTKPGTSADLPPPYESLDFESSYLNEKDIGVLHYARSDETVHSISLAYNVSMDSIRKANCLNSDHLIKARATVWIPGYRGPSKSAEPDEDDERKLLLKRFQVRSKCIDYQTALVYMSTANYDLAEASRNFAADLAWEKAHPKATFSRHK